MSLSACASWLIHFFLTPSPSKPHGVSFLVCIISFLIIIIFIFTLQVINAVLLPNTDGASSSNLFGCYYLTSWVIKAVELLQYVHAPLDKVVISDQIKF